MITGQIETNIGRIPKVAVNLTFTDYMGAIKARWGINRNNFKIAPGLYAVGNPTETSDVFVTANYKLSFDHLRKNLTDINVWVLVLDTKGINVWCAAGKGTFGTNELINRIKITRLNEVVSHRRIILPQLGAVGVAAHKVERETRDEEPTMAQPAGNPGRNTIFNPANLKPKANRGFSPIFGPVRALDIKDFIAEGYKATHEMRQVTFPFVERAKLIPVDLVYNKYYLLSVMALMLILSSFGKSGFSFENAYIFGSMAMLNSFLAYITGIAITPLLLPYIPVRSFALKGFISGLGLFVILSIVGTLGIAIIENISWLLVISALASFTAMNFTGASTYTSLSGVKKEMKIAIPLQIASAISGISLMIISKFI